MDTFLSFIGVGFRHILPLGADHVLFILALYLASPGVRAVILQAGVFTLAHTLTLGLSAAGWIAAPPSLVEPVIALSIVAAGADAALGGEAPRRRLAIAFLFGLVHGLGFASMVAGFLEGGDFFSGLVGFSLGVELGQLVVLAIAALASLAARRLLSLAGRGGAYRDLVARPAAILIALAGAVWFTERIAGLL